MPRLVILSGELAGQLCELTTEYTSVGRSDNNTLVIRDATVSGTHCEILVYGTEVIVRERGSTNGTFVGSKRVTGQLPAKVGDIIRFGSVQARLEFEPDTADGSTDLTAVWLHAQLKREKHQTVGTAPGGVPTIKLPARSFRTWMPGRSKPRHGRWWIREVALPILILVIVIGVIVAVLVSL